MKLFSYLSVVLIALPIEIAFSQPATNWGKPLYGTQLSISLSNCVMTLGSTNTLHCWIKNSSTNDVEIWREMSSLPELGCYITNSSGKAYELSSAGPHGGSHISDIHLNAGEIYECFFPVELAKGISPGDYEFKAVEWMYVPLNNTNNPGGFLESNVLKVHIRRWFWF